MTRQTSGPAEGTEIRERGGGHRQRSVQGSGQRPPSVTSAGLTLARKPGTRAGTLVPRHYSARNAGGETFDSLWHHWNPEGNAALRSRDIRQPARAFPSITVTRNLGITGQTQRATYRVFTIGCYHQGQHKIRGRCFFQRRGDFFSADRPTGKTKRSSSTPETGKTLSNRSGSFRNFREPEAVKQSSVSLCQWVMIFAPRGQIADKCKPG